MPHISGIAPKTPLAARIVILCLGCAVFGSLSTQPAVASAMEKPGWQELEPGLWYGRFKAPQPAEIGDSLIRVLRADPRLFTLKLLSASAFEEGRPMTAAQWGRRHNLKAAINASMYQKDHRTSVSLMRTQGHINNPRVSKDMSVLAFDRRSSSVPPVKIIDRECEKLALWRNKYRTLVQSIRMISCTGRNVWSEQPQRWSTAAIAVDRQGRILFIYVASPYSTHDLIEFLQMLPLGIQRAMYAEGGLPAQLYIGAGESEYEFAGGRKITATEPGGAAHPWAIPNVIGIVPIQSP